MARRPQGNISPKAVRTTRGEHPDLVWNEQSQSDQRAHPDVRNDFPRHGGFDPREPHAPSDPDTDYNRAYWFDEQFREAERGRQQRYADQYFPDEVRRDIYDRDDDYRGMTPSEARRAQNDRVRASFEEHHFVPPWAARDDKLYEKYFDTETGALREGFRKHRLEGDIVIRDDVDVNNRHLYTEDGHPNW